jgi:hypothetical protein
MTTRGRYWEIKKVKEKQIEKNVLLTCREVGTWVRNAVNHPLEFSHVLGLHDWSKTKTTNDAIHAANSQTQKI